MRAYGVPYKGSKNLLAEPIVEALPTRGADTFVDLFAGGGKPQGSEAKARPQFRKGDVYRA